MKFLTVFTVLCLVAYSTASPLFEDCDEEVQSFFSENACMHVECYSFHNETVNINKMSSHSCHIPRCDEGKEYKGENAGDKNAIYPGCCATAICE